MGEVELFDPEDDLEELATSKIIIRVFPVKGGFLPQWEMEMPEGVTPEEMLALREGVDLAANQFDHFLDMVFSYDEDDDDFN